MDRDTTCQSNDPSLSLSHCLTPQLETTIAFWITSFGALLFLGQTHLTIDVTLSLSLAPPIYQLPRHSLYLSLFHFFQIGVRYAFFITSYYIYIYILIMPFHFAINSIGRSESRAHIYIYRKRERFEHTFLL